MVITKLIMRNFRVFRGEHTLELSPNEEPGKPIVLIGGLNGSGKTSILTAIRLALYGQQAFDDVFTRNAYIERLASLVHNGKKLNYEEYTSASVELHFTLRIDGKNVHHCAKRSWKKGKIDTLDIYEDDVPMEGKTTEQLQGFLNELIPVGVGDLFFFDGEKIATLAEDETGSILRIAMQRLLGLDVVSRLKGDLNTYIKKDIKNKLSRVTKEQIFHLEARKDELVSYANEKRIESLDYLRGVQLHVKELHKYEALLIAQGKNFADSKVSEEAKLKVLETEKLYVEKQLRNNLDGYFPLALAPKTFIELFNQIDKEKEIIKAESFKSGLNDFLTNLRKELALRSSTTLKIATETIEDQLQEFLSNQPTGDIVLDVSEREHGILQNAFYHLSPKLFEDKNINCNKLERINSAIEFTKSNIERAPEEEQLSSTFEIIRKFDKSIRDGVEAFNKLQLESKKALLEAVQCTQELQKLHDAFKNKVSVDNASAYAQNVLTLLDEYAEKLTASRILEVENEFSKTYMKLARKGELKLRANIDINTFNVNLEDEFGNIIDRSLLSAGEKQIYAVTMLEALGKVSGKQLPIIIDTPLGRLDSKHRDKLVEHYLPEASHQVIVLSTDTEIDERYYNNYLRDSISKSYRIKYLSHSYSSTIENGYFWNNEKDKVGI